MSVTTYQRYSYYCYQLSVYLKSYFQYYFKCLWPIICKPLNIKIFAESLVSIRLCFSLINYCILVNRFQLFDVLVCFFNFEYFMFLNFSYTFGFLLLKMWNSSRTLFFYKNFCICVNGILASGYKMYQLLKNNLKMSKIPGLTFLTSITVFTFIASSYDTILQY